MSKMSPSASSFPVTQETKTATPVPRASMIHSPAIVRGVNEGALAKVTSAQRAFAAKLVEIEEWLSMPFVSAKAIASNQWLFTLRKHGETTFERMEDDGSVRIDEVHLWLADAQEEIKYTKNSGDMIEIAAGSSFIISQKTAKIRDRIAIEIQKILDETGESIPNITCRFAKMGSMAKAKGWSAPVTFAVAEYAELQA
jgi:hypothetical protein